MGRTYRFNKKDGPGKRKHKAKASRQKKKRNLGRRIASRDYDISEDRFERFTNHGKPSKS